MIPMNIDKVYDLLTDINKRDKYDTTVEMITQVTQWPQNTGILYTRNKKILMVSSRENYSLFTEQWVRDI